tara:strand:+ start:416 stop:523 length:108 start_codon:yes stop_codon:yes gene_type:complete
MSYEQVDAMLMTLEELRKLSLDLGYEYIKDTFDFI